MFVDRAKLHAPDIFGAFITGSATVTAWQVQAQWALSVTASLVAIVVGVLTIRSLLKKSASPK